MKLGCIKIAHQRQRPNVGVIQLQPKKEKKMPKTENVIEMNQPKRGTVNLKTFAQLWKSANSLNEARENVRSVYPWMDDKQISSQAATIRKNVKKVLDAMVERGELTQEEAESKNLQTYRSQRNWESIAMDILDL